MTDDCRAANVTFKTGNKEDTGQSDLPPCLRGLWSKSTETIRTHMKVKKHGSTKGKWCLSKLTALSDAMICSVE